MRSVPDLTVHTCFGVAFDAGLATVGVHIRIVGPALTLAVRCETGTHQLHRLIVITVYTATNSTHHSFI